MEIAQAADNGNSADDGDEEAQWSDVFWMLQEGGKADRGAHYALTIASLKRKGEDIHQQIDALRLAEGNLLQAARDEAAALQSKAEPRLGRDPKQARTWGHALARAVARQAKEASDATAEEEPPFAPTKMALEAQQKVADTLEAHNKAQAQIQAQAVAQAEQALRLQAEQLAQAQALAEAQAQALSEAQLQAEAVAEMQLQLQAEASMAVQAQEQLELAAAERNVLRAQGLNSKKLPLRPGVPPCGYFMRKGECKYGKACKWDHPEVMMNSRGFPMRPGETPCAFYMRMGTCRFASTCKFDHPENDGEANAAPLDMNQQLAQLTQAALAGTDAPGTLGEQEQLQSQLQWLLQQQAVTPGADN